MTDALVRGVLPAADLKWAVCLTGGLRDEARARHGLSEAAGELMGEAIAATALLAALEKGGTRVNLQLECDGPLRGLFVDASAEGCLRGYVKNVELPALAAALGKGGYLSVLRDLGRGEHYRSSVELAAMEIAADLERYFAVSDQVPTRVALSSAGGVLLQCLPGADPAVLERLGAVMKQGLTQALASGSPATAARILFGEEPFDVLATYPLEWKCTCSKDRVMRALATLGAEEVLDMIAKEGKASAKCQFCGRAYEISGEELATLLPKG
jgi:molecular chaperone Hsp33